MIGLRAIKTVISVFVCFVIDGLRGDSVSFYAVIASILCMQSDMESSLIYTLGDKSLHIRSR